jgi:hypothetical protein
MGANVSVPSQPLVFGLADRQVRLACCQHNAERVAEGPPACVFVLNPPHERQITSLSELSSRGILVCAGDSGIEHERSRWVQLCFEYMI